MNDKNSDACEPTPAEASSAGKNRGVSDDQDSVISQTPIVGEDARYAVGRMVAKGGMGGVL